jgi:hypothetical protein
MAEATHAIETPAVKRITDGYKLGSGSYGESEVQ